MNKEKLVKILKSYKVDLTKGMTYVYNEKDTFIEILTNESAEALADLIIGKE